MKVNQEKKKMRAVKSTFVLFPTECKKCGQEFYFEKMWKIYWYGMNNIICSSSYCKKCMPNKESVLRKHEEDRVQKKIVGIHKLY